MSMDENNGLDGLGDLGDLGENDKLDANELTGLLDKMADSLVGPDRAGEVLSAFRAGLASTASALLPSQRGDEYYPNLRSQADVCHFGGPSRGDAVVTATAAFADASSRMMAFRTFLTAPRRAGEKTNDGAKAMAALLGQAFDALGMQACVRVDYADRKEVSTRWLVTASVLKRHVSVSSQPRHITRAVMAPSEIGSALISIADSRVEAGPLFTKALGKLPEIGTAGMLSESAAELLDAFSGSGKKDAESEQKFIEFVLYSELMLRGGLSVDVSIDWTGLLTVSASPDAFIVSDDNRKATRCAGLFSDAGTEILKALGTDDAYGLSVALPGAFSLACCKSARGLSLAATASTRLRSATGDAAYEVLSFIREGAVAGSVLGVATEIIRTATANGYSVHESVNLAACVLESETVADASAVATEFIGPCGASLSGDHVSTMAAKLLKERGWEKFAKANGVGSEGHEELRAEARDKAASIVKETLAEHDAWLASVPKGDSILSVMSNEDISKVVEGLV